MFLKYIFILCLYSRGKKTADGKCIIRLFPSGINLLNYKSKYLGRYVLLVYDVLFHNVYKYTVITFAGIVRKHTVFPQRCLGFENGLESTWLVIMILDSFSN